VFAAGWWELLAAFVGGGLATRLAEIWYREFRRRADHAKSVREFVDWHLDPILKAADELSGKIHALSKEDFTSIYDVNAGRDLTRNRDLISLVFLLARFWASIEAVRLERNSFYMEEDARGKCLKQFIDCMESRKIRMVDRISQRAIAELMLSRRGESFQIGMFIEFVRLIEGRSGARRWLAPIVSTLSRMRHTVARQRLLKYGVVIHAMIDTLDPTRRLTKDRRPYPNKLSRKSRNDLKYRVFGKYLRFVSAPDKYYVVPPAEEVALRS